MSERATAFNLPPVNTQPAGGEIAVRPKVLRRPAHFGSKPVDSPVPVFIPLHQPYVSEESAPTPQPRAWQDDGKFAITLLGLVILVNLVVSAWLAAISPTKSAAHIPETVPAGNSGVHVLGTAARDISEQ